MKVLVTYASFGNRADRLWGPRSFLLNAYRGFFPPGVKGAERGVGHLSPFSADVNNEQS